MEPRVFPSILGIGAGGSHPAPGHQPAGKAPQPPPAFGFEVRRVDVPLRRSPGDRHPLVFGHGEVHPPVERDLVAKARSGSDVGDPDSRFAPFRKGHEPDPRDLLECGIEITAQPPGKTAKSLLLLSGGEKALTAISLLFAIFRFKPSPFCVLDEVDAPLDDANVSRFAAMVQRMKADTQFIVITHQKPTMVAADTLYGVTMQERGVSRLVSVQLKEAEQLV